MEFQIPVARTNCRLYGDRDRFSELTTIEIKTSQSAVFINLAHVEKFDNSCIEIVKLQLQLHCTARFLVISARDFDFFYCQEV